MLVLSLSTAFFVVPAKALDVPATIQQAKEAHDAIVGYIADELTIPNSDANNLAKKILAPLGFIVGYTTFSDAMFKSIFNGHNYGGIVFDDTGKTDAQFQDEVTKTLAANITVTDNSINFNAVSKSILLDYANAVINDCGYHYYYSYKLQDQINTSYFNDGNLYNACRLCLNDLGSRGWCWYSYVNHKIFFMPYDDDIAVLRTQNFTNYVYGTYYQYSTWQLTSKKVIEYVYDSTNHVYNESVSSNVNSTGAGLQKTTGNQMGAYGIFLSSTDYNQVLVFDTLVALKNYSVGNKPYYESDKWNSYKNNSDNYTVDSSNSNNVTYGDVTNYVNNYYGQNGEYPSNPVINVYIENNVPSGNGGDNGGGSGGSGGSGDLGIFDFLSRIGEVLGNLIKNLGNVLAELIEGISETITTLFESIPTVFSTFLQGVVGWLPPELLALLTLSISAMVIVGLIKMFRS